MVQLCYVHVVNFSSPHHVVSSVISSGPSLAWLLASLTSNHRLSPLCGSFSTLLLLFLLVGQREGDTKSPCCQFDFKSWSVYIKKFFLSASVFIFIVKLFNCLMEASRYDLRSTRKAFHIPVKL